ncbi:MAG: hypothetical protein HQL36_04740 [Alphaproteobacteria bacterium]|nr:hypothetical protein [Alphaproteobacteria bacterium]MBF0250054.1 hypothetical protein [Alphaproteobacteria bacterium]
MIFHPTILALLIGSALSSVMVLAGAAFGVRVLRRWDIASGRHGQLVLERRTYLFSVLLAFVMVAELLSLLLFVFNADRMSAQFVGAMCAVGTLNANAFGFPALILKIAVFFLASVWLIVNHVDNMGYDYPLIRVKYAMLIVIAPVVLAAAGVQAAYFLDLDPEVITSCCGKLFTQDATGVSAELAGLDEKAALVLLFGSLALAGVVAAVHARTGQGGMLYGAVSVLVFVAAIAGIVSVVSLYVYEHPNHHCPFCLLKPEYGYFGYWLYVPLFAGTVLGMGGGPIAVFAGAPSLAEIAPRVSRRLVTTSMVCLTGFGAACAYAILSSGLILFGT